LRNSGLASAYFLSAVVSRAASVGTPEYFVPIGLHHERRAYSQFGPETRTEFERKEERQQMLQNCIARLFARQEGQGLAEYALILALIAILAVVALMFIGTHISTVLSVVGNSV
jgi:pilus assembly protein Flp/PilA